MFTEIDKVLFPNKCEVLQTTSHDFIYPIFKNGSSSLYQTAKDQKWNILINNQIKKCNEISVFLREPKERFVSGIDTFINHNLTQELDKKTVIHFVNNYLFLNRHYMPQMFWLIHLAKYAKVDVTLHFKQISDIQNYTSVFYNVSENKQLFLLEDIPNINFYIAMDQFLFFYINQKITWIELIKKFKENNTLAYKHIFEYSEKLLNVLPKI